MAAPAWAGTLYDNGPIGYSGALGIANGVAVADSFTVISPSTLTGAQVGLWLVPYNELAGGPTSLDWMIGTSPELGNISSGAGAALSNAFAGTTYSGEPGPVYWVFESDFTLTGALVPGTTYWLTLDNAFDPVYPGCGADCYFNPNVYWDVDGGPSQAWDTNSGYLADGSESFQTYGYATPEPASLVLLASGMLIFAGFMRKITG